MDKMIYDLIYKKYLGILQPDPITSLLMTTCLCLLYGRMKYWPPARRAYASESGMDDLFLKRVLFECI